MPFKLTSKFFSVLGYLASFIIINLLCILCCIPVITAGPSICAMYYCILKISRKEDVRPSSEFFHSFRNNLKQGCILQIIVLLVGFILYFDLKLSLSVFGNSIIFKIVTCLLLMITFVFLLTLTMLYPVQAQFTNTLKDTFKNALLLAISHLPYAFVMLILNALPVILLVVWTNAFLFMIPFYVFFGFSIICFLDCFFLKKIFRPYLPEETSVDE